MPFADRQVATDDDDAPAIALAGELLQNSPHAVAIVGGMAHHVRYANRALLNLAGRDASQAVDRPFNDVLSFSPPSITSEAIDSALKLGTGSTGIRVILERGGRRSRLVLDTWQVASKAPRRDAVVMLRDDVPEGANADARMMAEMRDINQRLVLAALREEELTRQAESANRAKSAFLATMSHELRTPLNAIIGYGELLSEGITDPVTESQRRQLARINASASHLLALINEVLTLSRIEAGRESVRVGAFDAQELCWEALTVVTPQVRAKSLNLRVNLPPQTCMIESDPLKVKQILINLLNNAAHFTDEGEITLTMREAGNDIVWEVSDTGIGISPENLERIFDAFWQVEHKGARPSSGTGLGLHLSRRLARMLGGDVMAASTQGRGSTFTLRLPRRIVVR